MLNKPKSKPAQHRYTKTEPVTYQLYSQYLYKVWNKNKKGCLLPEENQSNPLKICFKKAKKIGAEGDKAAEEREEKNQRAEKRRDDDTLINLAQEFGRLDITKMIEENQKEKTKEEEKHLNMSKILQDVLHEEKPEPRLQRKEKPPTKIETRQVTSAPSVIVQESKSISNSKNSQNKISSQVSSKPILEKQGSFKQEKNPATFKINSKQTNQALLLIDETRTQPPPKEDMVLSHQEIAKSEYQSPKKHQKQVSVSSKSQIEDLKSRCEASEKENQSLRREIEKMKQMQDKEMEKIKKQMQDEMMMMFKQLTKKSDEN